MKEKTRRLEHERTIAKLEENNEMLKGARARADEKTRSLEQQLATANHELRQLRRGAATLADEQAIARFAELLVEEVAAEGPPAKIKKGQKKLIACLAPDKFPAGQTAAKLVQALQGVSSWD